MKSLFTIIYAYRDRETRRVKKSLNSLKKQQNQNFEVIFVDYGSNEKFASQIRSIVSSYDFVKYYYIAHPGLLWNKSKALNYGINKANGNYIFIADVDLIFHDLATMLFSQIADKNKVHTFKLGYLDRKNSNKNDFTFDKLGVNHIGELNGMLLVPKAALFEIEGYDEFYHFYAYEDLDLLERLQNLGLELVLRPEIYFKHIWHKIYNNFNESELSLTPRLSNAKRVNKVHYFRSKELNSIKPFKSMPWNHKIDTYDSEILNNPNLTINRFNFHEAVMHLFNLEIKGYNNKVIEIIIEQHKDYTSPAYYLKKILNKPVRKYLSMKEVNDIILSKIIFEYRDNNYNYFISKDFKKIKFTIELN